MSKNRQFQERFYKKKTIFIWASLLFVVGIAVGWGIAALVFNGSILQTGTSLNELRAGGYQFVDPLLVANPTRESIPLESKLKSTLSANLNNPDVENVSIYFQDLNSGLWAGVNESDTYNPASLLKVPYMMTYLKEAETDPGILSQEFPYQAEPADGTSTQFDKLVPGQAYTVLQLLKAMIVDSDNGAKYTLLLHADQNAIDATFSNLDITAPNVQNYIISDKEYARFFKILYNATYLDPDLSEQAMELLSSSTFNSGLVAGVPSGIPVAHKFGQYTSATTTISTANPWELSDCGIVYYPKDPYLLCVMTRGLNLDELSGVIQSVSKSAYTEVNNHYQ